MASTVMINTTHKPRIALHRLQQKVRSANILTRACERIWRICGSKPMSNIRSASSRTRYEQRSKFVSPALRKSISLPGVAIQICKDFNS